MVQRFVRSRYTIRPEQVRGEELDARTDLFSFGVVLYEMVTGVLPFRGETSGVVAEAILNRGRVAPVRLNPDLSPKLEEIITKALEKDTKFRHQSAAEIRTDLQRLKRDTDYGRASVSGATGCARTRRAKEAALGLYPGGNSSRYACRESRFSFTAAKPTPSARRIPSCWPTSPISTGDAVFDDTLKQALTVSLRQSPFLKVLSDEKIGAILRLMTRPTSTPLTPVIAREVCQRAGSKARSPAQL